MDDAPVLRPRVLVTIPAKDEGSRLLPSLISLKEALDNAGIEYRLSVAEDGSTDGTKDLFPTIRAQIPGILIQNRDKPLGRGRAIRTLWSTEVAEIYGFCDADLASGAQAMVDAIRLAQEGKAIVIGSRYVEGATVIRPPLRSLVSHIYNGLIRFAFDDKIADHQCGLKVFRAAPMRRILPVTHEDSWFWDTEVVVVAHELGFEVVEMPVAWVEKKVRRTSIRRLLSDIYLHGTGLLRLKSNVDESLKVRPSDFIGPQTGAPASANDRLDTNTQ